MIARWLALPLVLDDVLQNSDDVVSGEPLAKSDRETLPGKVID